MNILTLGYNPEQNYLVPPLLPSDFKHDGKPADLYGLLYKVIADKIKSSGAKRIGIASGGGLDSNAVLCVTADVCKELGGLDLFTIPVDYEDPLNSEVADAKRISDKLCLGCEVNHVYNPLEHLPLEVSLIQEPRFKLYEFDYVQHAKKILRADLLLTGDGGDEVFAGYNFRYRQYGDLLAQISGTFPNVTPVDKVRCYLWGHNRNWVNDQSSMFGSALGSFDWNRIYRLLLPYFSADGLDPLEQVWLADYNGKLLFDFVPTDAAFFSYFGIDGYAPLLAPDVVAYGASLPVKAKYDSRTNAGKLPLVDLMGKRYPAVASMLAREKTGYGINILTLWNRCGRRLCVDYIDQVIKDRWISDKWFSSALEKADGKGGTKPDPRYMSKLLQVLGFEIWYRLFITETINPHLRLVA